MTTPLANRPIKLRRSTTARTRGCTPLTTTWIRGLMVSDLPMLVHWWEGRERNGYDGREKAR
jgi:hypothetical protein